MNRIIGAFLLALPTLSIYAQQKHEDVLTIEQCRERALETNKGIRSAEYSIQKQTYDMRAVRANFFPKFDLKVVDFFSTLKMSKPTDDMMLPTASFDFTAGTYLPNVIQLPNGQVIPSQIAMIPSEAINAKISNVFIGSVSLMQPIFMGGKIVAGYRMAKTGQKMAEAKKRLTMSEVIVKTDEAYALAVKAKELYEAASSYVDLLTELKKNVDAAVAHGMRTKNDAMKVQVKLNEARLSLMKAGDASRLAQMNLAQIVGLPMNEPIAVTSDFVNQELVATVENSAIELRPEYELLENRTELARQQVRMARSEFLPTVVAGASYMYTNGIKVNDKKLLDNGSFNVGAMVQIPLFHFGEGINKVRSAKASLQIAQIEQEELNERMQLELAQATNTLNESSLEVQVTKDAVEQALLNMQMARRQYEVGLETLSDLLEAQALWQSASARHAEAKAQYILANTKYLKASGAL